MEGIIYLIYFFLDNSPDIITDIIGIVKRYGNISAQLYAEPCIKILIACKTYNSCVYTFRKMLVYPRSESLTVLFELFVAMLNKLFFLILNYKGFFTEALCDRIYKILILHPLNTR